MTTANPARFLLEQLDKLDHDQRMERVSLLARDQAGRPELTALMDALAQGDGYQRRLGLQMARVVGDRARLRAMLNDDSLHLQHGAAAWLGTHGQDPQEVLAVLLEASPEVRRRLMGRLLKHRRRALIEALMPELLARFDPAEVARLVPSCGPEVARRCLTLLGHHLINWKQLAGAHPELTLETLEGALEGAEPRMRAALWARFAGALGPLSRTRAGALVGLIERFGVEGAVIPGVVSAHLGALLRREPARVVGLLTRPQGREALRVRGLPREAQAHIGRLEEALVEVLAEALADNPEGLGALLEEVAPSRRGAIFERAMAGRDTSAKVWPARLMEALPHALRHREATRMAALREVGADDSLARQVASWKRFEEAREALADARRSARAEVRAHALTLLIRAAARHPDTLSEAIDALGRIKNEQDPVRLVAFEALASLPPSAFIDGHAPGLGQAVKDALEARDLSWGSRRAIHVLAHRLMIRHGRRPEGPLFTFGLEALRALAGQGGVMDFPRLDAGLPRGAERHIWETLVPWLREASLREADDNIIRLVLALGKRAWRLDEAQALLGRLCRSKLQHIATRATAAWLACPWTRDARVRALLDDDPSAFVLTTVAEHLHRRRQSWLDPYLEGKPLQGNFVTGKTVHLPSFQGGFWRWLPRQQRAFAALLGRVIHDTKRPTWSRSVAVRQLGQLPVTTVEALRPLVASDEVTVAEAALGTVIWLDEPTEALSLLLEHLDGDRARVAMYAMPRLARLIAPARLLDALERLLARPRLKVTVHKEALRLLGELSGDRVVSLLEARWTTPGLHRDVRIAVLHAVRRHLDRPEAWAMLEQASASDDAEVALSLLSIWPGALRDDQRAPYRALILKLGAHPGVEVRRTLFGALASSLGGGWSWGQGAHGETAACARRELEDLDGGEAWESAVNALVEAARSPDPEAHAQLREALEALIDAAATEGRAPGPERDLPARQRLERLIDQVAAMNADERASWRAPVLSPAITALQAHPWLASLRLRLEAAAILWREPRAAEAIEALAMGADPMALHLAIEALREALYAHRLPVSEETLVALADGLLTSADPRARAVAVFLAEHLWQARESIHARRLLGALRLDPNPSVADAACQIWLTAE